MTKRYLVILLCFFCYSCASISRVDGINKRLGEIEEQAGKTNTNVVQLKKRVSQLEFRLKNIAEKIDPVDLNDPNSIPGQIAALESKTATLAELHSLKERLEEINEGLCLAIKSLDSHILSSPPDSCEICRLHRAQKSYQARLDMLQNKFRVQAKANDTAHRKLVTLNVQIIGDRAQFDFCFESNSSDIPQTQLDCLPIKLAEKLSEGGTIQDDFELVSVSGCSSFGGDPNTNTRLQKERAENALTALKKYFPIALYEDDKWYYVITAADGSETIGKKIWVNYIPQAGARAIVIFKHKKPILEEKDNPITKEQFEIRNKQIENGLKGKVGKTPFHWYDPSTYGRQ